MQDYRSESAHQPPAAVTRSPDTRGQCERSAVRPQTSHVPGISGCRVSAARRPPAHRPQQPRCAGTAAAPGIARLASVSTRVRLTWTRFESLTAARSVFGSVSCVYVQADHEGRAVRVGKASAGLHSRYRGGTGWALDAAMHGSGNLVFVAPVNLAVLDAVESTLIWVHRSSLRYNRVGRRIAPEPLVEIEHVGEIPVFDG